MGIPRPTAIRPQSCAVRTLGAGGFGSWKAWLAAWPDGADDGGGGDPRVDGLGDVAGLLAELDVASGKPDQLVLARALETGDLHRPPHPSQDDGSQGIGVQEAEPRPEPLELPIRPGARPVERLVHDGVV